MLGGYVFLCYSYTRKIVPFTFWKHYTSTLTVIYHLNFFFLFIFSVEEALYDFMDSSSFLWWSPAIGGANGIDLREYALKDVDFNKS